MSAAAPRSPVRSGKLSPAQIVAVGRLADDGIKQAAIARQFGVTPRTIRKVLEGRSDTPPVPTHDPGAQAAEESRAEWKEFLDRSLKWYFRWRRELLKKVNIPERTAAR